MRSSPTSNLRVIEPFRSKDGIRAEVYKSKLGGKPVVVIESDSGRGEDAEVVLNVREAHDLMLWLQCALELPAVETTTEQSVGKLVIDYAMELETTRKALAETIEYARQWMPSDRYRYAHLMCRGVVHSSSEEPTANLGANIRHDGGIAICGWCGFALITNEPRQCCPQGQAYDAASTFRASEKASGKHDSSCVYYYGKPCDCGAVNGTRDE